MKLKFLLPENVARQNGAGPVVDLDEDHGKPLLLTLGITRSVEQESLEISLWGSSDKENWRALATFPQKFYCGTYSLLLDLSGHRDVGYLRVQWKMSCWGRGESTPLFGFYLLAEEGKLHAVA